MMQDFHIVKLPLTEEEIRGVGALKEFGQWLLQPYSAPAQPDQQSRYLTLIYMHTSALACTSYRRQHLKYISMGFTTDHICLYWSCCRIEELEGELEALKQHCAALEHQLCSKA